MVSWSLVGHCKQFTARYFRSVKCSGDGAYVGNRTLVHAGANSLRVHCCWRERGPRAVSWTGHHCVGVLQQRLLDGVDVLGHDRHHVLHRLGHDRGHLPQQLFAGRRGIKRNQVVHVAFGEVLLKCRNHGLHNFVPGHIVEHLVRSRGHLGFVVGGQFVFVLRILLMRH